MNTLVFVDNEEKYCFSFRFPESFFSISFTYQQKWKIMWIMMKSPYGTYVEISIILIAHFVCFVYLVICKEDLNNTYVENSTFSRNEKSSFVETTESHTQSLTPTRIAIYDDFLSAPRIVDITPTEISQYIEDISSKTYELAQQKGSSIPYTVIREVCENFIHAQFKDPCISILDDGNTIKFTDQGPGIEDKQRAQNPGFTSATTEMRQYIRGVGSGFPIVRDYLRFSNGRLIIEDNIKEGTVVTIQIDTGANDRRPVVYRETPNQDNFDSYDLTQRDYNILSLTNELGIVGPTDVKQNLNIPVATAQRCLDRLEDAGLLTRADGSKKRMLTDNGLSVLDR